MLTMLIIFFYNFYFQSPFLQQLRQIKSNPAAAHQHNGMHTAAIKSQRFFNFPHLVGTANQENTVTSQNLIIPAGNNQIFLS